MKERTHLMHRILKYGENSKNLKDLERIWGSLDAIKELYDRAEVTNREQTNCEENIGEVISKQNSIIIALNHNQYLWFKIIVIS